MQLEPEDKRKVNSNMICRIGMSQHSDQKRHLTSDPTQIEKYGRLQSNRFPSELQRNKLVYVQHPW